MEQRALLAVALIAGSVTAAGAGGYFAVRQLATEPPAAVSETASTAPAQPAPVVEGTEAEIAPAPPPEPEPAPPPATRVVPQEPRVRPSASTPARPAPAPRATPAVPARPAASPSTPRDEPARTGTWTRAPQPVEPPVGRDQAPGTDRWPARDTTDAAPAEREPQDWPRRDTATDAEGSLPARTSAGTPEPPAATVRRMEAVTIPADAVIGVQIETSVSSQTARVEDPVRARVTRDVFANGEVVVPAGSRLLGSVTLVEEGGKIRERARLGVRFHTLVLADGTEVRLPTETIYRDGESPAGRSAAKIGGAAVGGAVLGAILGGGRGAIIGAATGAGSGTAVAMAGERKPAELRAGQPVTVRVSDSVASQIER